MKQYQFIGITFSSIEKIRDFILQNRRNYGCEKHLDLNNKPIWLIENGKRTKIAVYNSPEFEGVLVKSEYKSLFY